MSPITHWLVSWAVANSGGLNRKDRALVTLAGVLPDFDGLGLVTDWVTRHTAHPTNWWGVYHHLLGHNLGFGLLLALLALRGATQRRLTALLVLLSFHLHLLGDVVGARGPDGDQWPVPYLWPLSNRWLLAWSGQWALNAWPNFLITGLALAVALYWAWGRGYSPLELLWPRADRAVVAALRQRFPGTSHRKAPPIIQS